MNGKKIDPPKLTDFEISILIIERDTAQFHKERIDELLNEIGAPKGYEELPSPQPTTHAGTLGGSMPATKKQESPAVNEQTFLCLPFEPQEGQRIGPYDVAYEPQSPPEKWTHAMNILKANKAVIEKRFHGPGYKFAYWLFGEHKIYRQALKQPSAQ
jgi:hypothetical protein